jgi:hypothetical protein
MREIIRYRQEHEFYCIDIVITNILQLFDRRDPSPFKEKDLDEDFARYLTLAMRELNQAEKVKLIIKMHEHVPKYLHAKDVEEAIFTFFSFEFENSENDLKLLFNQGRSALVMGLAFLALCYTGFYFTKDQKSLFFGVLGEGFHVLGWVAMWKPINLFLYEWWPIRDRIRLLGKLKKLKVEIVTD